LIPEIEHKQVEHLEVGGSGFTVCIGEIANPVNMNQTEQEESTSQAKEL